MKIADRSVLCFSAEHAPLFHAGAGEVILFRTEDCFANQIRREDQLVSSLDFSTCNPAAGPVYIDGAEPGDILTVDILDIQVAGQGVCCTVTGLGPLWDTCRLRTRVIPVQDGVARFNGLSWAVKPMIGVIGTAPGRGSVPCGHPFDGGGNLDSARICRGTRVYLPVRVPGGLLQMGDLHASMGDGEVVGTGIEIAGEVLTRVGLIKGAGLNWPVSETAEQWYVHTCHFSLGEAVRTALHEMQRLVVNAYGWDETDAAIYLSIRGQVEINQCCMDADVENVVRVGIPNTPQAAPLLR